MKIHLVRVIKLIYFMYTKNSSKKPTLIQTCQRHIENKKGSCFLVHKLLIINHMYCSPFRRKMQL